MIKSNIKTLKSSRDFIKKPDIINKKIIIKPHSTKIYNVKNVKLKEKSKDKINTLKKISLQKFEKEININTLSYKKNNVSLTTASLMDKTSNNKQTNTVSQSKIRIRQIPQRPILAKNLQRIKIKNSQKVINFTEIQKRTLKQYNELKKSGTFTEIRKPTDRIKNYDISKDLHDRSLNKTYKNSKPSIVNQASMTSKTNDISADSKLNRNEYHYKSSYNNISYNSSIYEPTEKANKESSYNNDSLTNKKGSFKEDKTYFNYGHSHSNKTSISDYIIRPNSLAKALLEKQKVTINSENKRISTISSPKDRIKGQGLHEKDYKPTAKRNIQKNMLKEYIYYKSRDRNEEDNTNYGISSYKKSIHSSYTAKRNLKKITKTYSKAKTISIATASKISKIIKAITAVISKIASLKGLLIALIALIPVILLVSVVTGFQTILPAQFVLCDDVTRALVQQIADDEGAEQMENFRNEVESAKESYDEVYEYIYGDGFDVDYRYILCLLAVMTNQNINDEALNKIPQIHNMFYEIDVETKEREEIKSSRIEDPETGEITYEEETVTITIITFKVKSFSVLEVADNLGFNDIEIDWLNALLSNELTYEQGNNPSVPSLSEAEINELLNNIQNEDERNIVKTALSLLGITRYEWGGKAEAGGTPKGLDCSGFVSWVYKTSLGYYGLDGGGTAYQFGVTDSVNNGELKIGDLGFWKYPSETAGTPSNANHVGIYIGKDENGNNLFIHSQGGTGVCISAFPFKHFKRVNY
ncbi:C40 family peptidase [Clostridium cochlearium]|uniref:C40 family peptidase n=1 Tax=Clostridium cochlearium TaxID=1494 RepID=UPI00241F2313|nr:NlpC/P60 family protein [Clostridium cochlearium]MBE6065896.1 NlpC/P60 family protein [Clostridium cochlearium]